MDGPDRYRALLLIDFQDDFLADDGRMPVARDQVEPVLAATRAAIAQAHARGDLIVQIGNEFRPRDLVGNLSRRGAAIAGRPGTRWDPRFAAAGAVYLAKWRGDAFCNPALEKLLREQRIQEIVVAGLYARACVAATTKAALARGFQVQVLGDAVACRSDASREAALGRIRGFGAQVISFGQPRLPSRSAVASWPCRNPGSPTAYFRSRRTRIAHTRRSLRSRGRLPRRSLHSAKPKRMNGKAGIMMVRER